MEERSVQCSVRVHACERMGVFLELCCCVLALCPPRSPSLPRKLLALRPKVECRRPGAAAGTTELTRATLTLVDLAGSERVKRSGVSGTHTPASRPVALVAELKPFWIRKPVHALLMLAIPPTPTSFC